MEVTPPSMIGRHETALCVQKLMNSMEEKVAEDEV